MIYKYIYEPAALSEYKDALKWYKERSETAAENFVAAIKEKITNICTSPLRYRNTYKYFRETSLQKFPYNIVYFTDDDKKMVIIAAIFHHKRNPKKKYKTS